MHFELKLPHGRHSGVGRNPVIRMVLRSRHCVCLSHFVGIFVLLDSGLRRCGPHDGVEFVNVAAAVQQTQQCARKGVQIQCHMT